MKTQTRSPIQSKVGWLLTALLFLPLVVATLGPLITADPKHALILEAPMALAADTLHVVGVCLAYGLFMSIVPALVFTRLGSRPIPQGSGPHIRVPLRLIILVFIASVAFNLGLDFWEQPDAVLSVLRRNPIGTYRFTGWLLSALPLTVGWTALYAHRQRRRLLPAASLERLTG